LAERLGWSLVVEVRAASTQTLPMKIQTEPIIPRAAHALLGTIAAIFAATLSTPLRADGDELLMLTSGDFAPAEGPGSLAHRIDLFSGAGWMGNECRLVSFPDTDLWLMDAPGGLRFTGSGDGLGFLGEGTLVDGRRSFVQAGYLSTDDWSVGTLRYLGLHRNVGGADYFGAIAFRWNEDHTFSILGAAMDLDVFDTSRMASVLPIPEPEGALAAALAMLVVSGVLARRRSVAERAGGRFPHRNGVRA